MSNIDGLDLIRNAYSKAISQNIENGNFSQSKFLLESLEKLASELQTVPVVCISKPSSDDLEFSVDDLEMSNSSSVSEITEDVMRDFIITYVKTHGDTKADKVADSFGMIYGEVFNAADRAETAHSTCPRWRKRFFNEASKLRNNNILMPHLSPYCYVYSLTPEYVRENNDISVVM